MNEIEQHRQKDDEDWKTIRAILASGGSLPFDLQRKYDRHMEEIHTALRALAKQ